MQKYLVASLMANYWDLFAATVSTFRRGSQVQIPDAIGQWQSPLFNGSAVQLLFGV